MLTKLRFLFCLWFVIFLVSGTVYANRDTLRIGAIALPPTIGNPSRNTGIPHLFTWSAIFDGLTRFDANGSLRPWLANSWENTDQLTWVIKLRDEIKFSNGESFNAFSVVTSLKFLKSKNALKEAVAKEFDFIRSVKVIDNLTVEITTNQPNPFLPRSLPLLHIVEPKLWLKLGPEEFAKKPVGTGPYKLIHHSPSKFKFESFTNSTRAPKIKKIEIIF